MHSEDRDSWGRQGRLGKKPASLERKRKKEISKQLNKQSPKDNNREVGK